MREIKFRAWDIDGRDDKMKMFYDITDISVKNLMQFTGLKDKNGKEIYEGDIVQYNEFGKLVNYEIVYSVGDKKDSLTNDYYIGAWMLKDSRGYYQLICNVTRPYQYAEIIGNLYETPELLNAQP